MLAVGLVHATATYVYDANGRLRAVTNSTGVSAEYTYDAMGNLVQIQSVPAKQLAIFAFTPNHGAVGTPVTISGQGFSTTVANDTVKFNGTVATVTAATATTLTTSVPVGASTGLLTVSVGTSTVTSSDLFTVDTTGQPPVITSFSPSIGAPGTAVTVLGKNLDPIANESYPAIDGMKASPTSASQTQVVFPVTSVMGSGKISVTTPYGMGVSSADFFVTPPGISAATVAVATRVSVGASVPLSIPVGKYAAVLFDASAGSWLSFQASNLANNSNVVSYTIYDGHNQPLMNGTLSTTNASIHLPMIPITGTYSVWLSSSTAANVTLALQADQTLQLSKALSTSVASAGQSQRLFFNATANQTLGLQIASQVMSPSDTSVQYAITAPNGVQVTSSYPTTATFINLPYLPLTSMYTILVTPNSPATGTSQLVLVTGVAATMPVSGPSVNVATTLPGENAYLTFTATAGENVGVGLSNLVVTPDGNLSLSVYSAQGNYINSTTCYASNGTCGLDLQNLAAGQYQITLAVPGSSDTMSAAVTLTQDVAGTLPLNKAISSSVPRYGETASYTFSATAGQTMALAIGAPTTVPGGNFVAYTLYAPNGSVLDSLDSTSGFTWNLPSLSASGTYKLYVVPSNGASLSQTLELASGVTGTVTVNGASVSVATTIPGENAYLTFTATAGENVGLGLSNMSVTPDGSLSLSVYDAQGNYINSTTCSVDIGACGLDLQNLAAGQYQIALAVPGSSDTMSATVTATQDAMGTLPLNQAVSSSLPRYGETASYTFSATAGQTLALAIGAPTTVPSGNYVTYILYAPNGSVLDSQVSTGSLTWNLSSLSVSGTYKLSVAPSNGATLSQTLELVSGVTGTVTVNGPSMNVAPPVAGENAYLTFTATAGENVGLGLSKLSVTPDGYLILSVYDAQGNYINSTDCNVSNGACGLDLQNLAAGQYQITLAVPGNSDAMSATVMATQDATGTLPLNKAVSSSLPRYGQTASYTFSATAGQTLALTSGAPTTMPSGSAVTYILYAPNGSELNSTNTTGAFTWNLPNLSASGTYKLSVVPSYGATLSQTLELVSGVTGTVAVNGASVNVATTVAGENAYLTFTATAGESVRVILSNLSETPDAYLTLSAYDAKGNFAGLTSCDTGSSACELDLQNLTAGQCQITLVVPGSSDTMSATVALTSP